MSRTERKGAVVTRIKDKKTGREGAVRLDKGTMMFFARVPDVELTIETKGRPYFESRDGKEVERWLALQLKKDEKPHALTWLGVIEIEFDVSTESGRYSRDSHAQERKIKVGVEIDRFLIALSEDETQWLKLKWAECDEKSSAYVEPEDRLQRAERFKNGPKAQLHSWDKAFKLPVYYDGHNYLAYTDELWAGLNEVIDTLARSGDTLKALMTTKKGIATIAEVGAGLKRLGSGSIAPEGAKP